jgi:hypothetical protein
MSILRQTTVFGYINTPALTLCLFSGYLGPKVSPLIAVDWTEIAHLSMLQTALVQKLARTIAVPNVNLLGSQFIRIGTSLYCIIIFTLYCFVHAPHGHVKTEKMYS